MIGLLFIITESCKKKKDEIIHDCKESGLIIGKWKFVSRKVTDYKTGLPSTPATNVTVNFDQSSYIEFTSDNKFKWVETYNNKSYRDFQGTTECAINKFTIFLDKSKGSSIPEKILELNSSKLIFQYHVLGVGETFTQTVITELSK